jgi:aquaporin rerated protein, other eukaryote
MARPTPTPEPDPGPGSEIVPAHPVSPPEDASHSSDEDAPAPPPPQNQRSGSQRRSGSRRRPFSGRAPPGKMPSHDSVRSSRPLRYRDDWDDEWDERAYDRYWRDDWREPPHPDFYDRRPSQRRPRPPLSRMNRASAYDDLDSPRQPYGGGGGDFGGYDEAPPPRRPAGAPRRPVPDEEQGLPSGQVQWGELTKEQKAEVLRIPWTQWMNSNVKNHFVASLGEFTGTTLFLLFAFAGTEVANIQSRAAADGNESNTTTGAATGFDVGVLMYIALCFGFSLMVNVWVFFRISGGLFNPAVTLAMVLVRAIGVARAACLFVSQMCGALLASVIVRFLFPENFNVRTTLGGGASQAQGVLIEAVLTAELVFTIFMLAKEKHRATFMAPVGIGLALFIAEMVGVQFTGGSLNPARSFGPCAVTATFDPEHWIYCELTCPDLSCPGLLF